MPLLISHDRWKKRKQKALRLSKKEDCISEVGFGRDVVRFRASLLLRFCIIVNEAEGPRMA